MAEKGMKKLHVSARCAAVYNSSILVPEGLDLKEAIEYAKKHIDEIPVGELDYISDTDELDEENCFFDSLEG